PLPEVSTLGARSPGYAYEAETLLRAVRRGWNVVELPVRVIYPPEHERTTHFHVARDPARIVYRVLQSTLLTRRRGGWRRLVVLVALLALSLPLAHVTIGLVSRPERLLVPTPTGELVIEPGLRQLGRS